MKRQGGLGMGRVFFGLMWIFVSQTLGMGIDRFSDPQEDFLNNLVRLRVVTFPSKVCEKPDLRNFYGVDRRFVAKLISHGFNVWFSCETNQHVEAIVESLQNGGGDGASAIQLNDDIPRRSSIIFFRPGVSAFHCSWVKNEHSVCRVILSTFRRNSGEILAIWIGLILEIYFLSRDSTVNSPVNSSKERLVSRR